LCCRFLDEYDLKVPSGAFKYKKAAEFLMNTIIIGIKDIANGIVQARDQAVLRAQTAEATITQVRTLNTAAPATPTCPWQLP